MMRFEFVSDDDLIEFFLMQGWDIDVPQTLMFSGIYIFFIALLVGLWLVYDVVTSSVISVFGIAFFITISIKSLLILLFVPKSVFCRHWEGFFPHMAKFKTILFLVLIKENNC